MISSTTAVRTRICFACGGGIAAPLEGGEIACPVCAALQSVGARPPVASACFAAGAGAAASLSEPERLTALRAQRQRDNSPYATFDAPAQLAHLELAYDDERLPTLLLEAFRVAIARCEADGERASFASQRDVVWIASKARNSYALRSEMLRATPYIETAREVVRDPGLVQKLVLMAVDGTRRGGDLDEAERLLAGCDGRSMFLELDSDYRTTAAMLALARADHARVLALVGERDDDVPFGASSVYQACMTRTAALESLGRGVEAERALAFNRDALGDDIIDDWLDGSELLRPTLAVWRRMRARDDSRPSPAGFSLGALVSEDDESDARSAEVFSGEDASDASLAGPPYRRNVAPPAAQNIHTERDRAPRRAAMIGAAIGLAVVAAFVMAFVLMAG